MRETIKTMDNMNNFNQLLRARRRTVRFTRTVDLISPIWKFVEKDAINSRKVNCKHCNKSWVNLNGSTSNPMRHVINKHINLLTEADIEQFFWPWSWYGWCTKYTTIC